MCAYLLLRVSLYSYHGRPQEEKIDGGRFGCLDPETEDSEDFRGRSPPLCEGSHRMRLRTLRTFEVDPPHISALFLIAHEAKGKYIWGG